MTKDTRPDIPFGFTYDDTGNELTYRNELTGYWCEYTRDEQGRPLTYKDSDGTNGRWPHEQYTPATWERL